MGGETQARTIVSKILVPIDKSREAMAATAYAVAVARPLGASVTLLHVVELLKLPTYLPGVYAEDQERLHDQQREDGASFLNSMREYHLDAGVPIDAVLLEGSPKDAIVDLATQDSHDLIVIGHRGLGLAQSLLIGSVSSYVIRSAPCPVLVVRGKLPSELVGDKPNG